MSHNPFLRITLFVADEKQSYEGRAIRMRNQVSIRDLLKMEAKQDSGLSILISCCMRLRSSRRAVRKRRWDFSTNCSDATPGCALVAAHVSISDAKLKIFTRVKVLRRHGIARKAKQMATSREAKHTRLKNKPLGGSHHAAASSRKRRTSV
jgi:hypothetical protein